jgi:hypothetical protein
MPNTKNANYKNAGGAGVKSSGAASHSINKIVVGSGSKKKSYTVKYTTKGKGKNKQTFLNVAGLKYDVSGMKKGQQQALVKKIKSDIKYLQKNGLVATTDKKGNVTYKTKNGVKSISSDAAKLMLNEDIKSMLISSLSGVEGLPYQFLPTVDPRYKINSKEIATGRKYAEKIAGRMPLVFFTPVKPVFMDDFNKSDVRTVLSTLVSGTELKQELLEGQGRYYSVKFDYTTYYHYLNTMMKAMAAYLGISHVEFKLPGRSAKEIGSISWQNDTNKAFKTFFSAQENVVFYADGLNQVSETFSNDTMESSIASQINGASDTMKELNQLIGGTAKGLKKTAQDAVGLITKGLSPAVTAIGGGILGSLAEYGVDTVLNGGKIIFPKLWGNSSHGSSFSINFKLRSPDHDKVSLYMNILKPYAKILALTLPRMIKDSPNAFNAPFLVKVSCKGMINIDMGIITSLSVTKGNECAWSDDGIPTELDISVEVEDLYAQAIAMSETHSKAGSIFGLKDTKLVVQNTAYMDFLANNCGLNIAQMEIGRRVQMFYYLTKGNIADIPSSLMSIFDQGVSGIMGSLYDIF